MSEKITDKIKKTLKHFGIIVTIIVISSILGMLLPNNRDSIYGIFSWILICYIMLGYFNIVFTLSDQKEISSLNRKANNTKKNLYQWLANVNWDEISIYQLLKEEEKNDITSNLKEIKKAIRIKVGNDIYDYYLLKNYLEYHGQHNFMNSVWKTFGVVLFGGLAGAFTKLGIIDQIYKLFAHEQKSSGALEQVEIIIQIGVMSLFTIIVFLFIKKELTKEKRRIDLLTSIVGTIIKEEEAKRKKLN